MILTLLFTTFVTVFLAEMGDKTQLTTITLSSTTNKPLAVFIGSSIALLLATLLGAFPELASFEKADPLKEAQEEATSIQREISKRQKVLQNHG